MSTNASSSGLSRKLGLAGLAATGICSMIGASIYVVPFMIQRNVPGIGDWVLPAFLFAAIPALLAAFAYASLSSAMPRAGGSYVFASRGLHPYLGFVASFSQWFGLSIVIGVVAYVVIPFLRDIANSIGWASTAEALNAGWLRVGLSLGLVWLFVWVNIRGLKAYVKALLPLMLLMFSLGAIVIVTGASYNHMDFNAALEVPFTDLSQAPFDWNVFLAAAAILFSSFIGFDSIAQAGGEAKNPQKTLPKAIGLAILGVGIYYFSFASAVYHAVPWQYVAAKAMEQDITATSLLEPLLSPALAIFITAGAAIALINDLPAMLLSVSRLVFAWAKDGIFPRALSATHSTYQTPNRALVLSGTFASIGVLGSHFAGDFFLGIDIMVLAMLFNFFMMSLTLLTIPKINPALADNISILKNPALRKVIAILGILFIGGFMVIHIAKDLNNEVSAWYFRSTPVWLIVMSLGTMVFAYQYRNRKAEGHNMQKLFNELPDE